MRKGLMLVASIGWAAAAVAAAGQVTGKSSCSCGSHPPGPPKDRTVEPYAGEPQDLSPFEKFSKPYELNYIHPNIYSGAGRDVPEPKDVTEVRIGFFGPIEHNPDQVFGLRMLHGAQLSVDEANARGGYGGKPFRLMLHNDYDNWQAKAAYGPERPTDSSIWGSPSDEAVKMIYDDKDWAIFGSISSESTHIILRLALRAEIPIVNSASTDPTIPETYIPWYFTNLQDDRVQTFTLARHIYSEIGLKRMAILRVNNRYGRMGVPKFRDASRRLGHPVVIEQKYMPGDRDFTHELRIIRSSHVDGIVLWANEAEAAGILKQMHALGMKQRVFGSYRTLGPDLLAQAGPDAEGFEAVFPYDPTRNDPKWVDFNASFETKFHEKPEQFASLAYDAMNALLESICKAGLNRARIHDALADIDHYDGATGQMVFDPNQKNVAPMYLATVHNGEITYHEAGMEKTATTGTTTSLQQKHEAAPVPYARVGEDGVNYSGPQRADMGEGPMRVVLFGAHADTVAQSAEVKALLKAPDADGRSWAVLAIASDQSWGAASSQLVSALWDKHACAIVALDRDAAHLSEQLSLKAFVPVIALSDDKTLTSTNVPWIFRLPAEVRPAAAIQLLETAAARSGPNSERLRDELASGHDVAGIAFLPTGEPRVK
jgi:branched-chain amino acid transport system substrate-binding protein